MITGAKVGEGALMDQSELPEGVSPSNDRSANNISASDKSANENQSFAAAAAVAPLIPLAARAGLRPKSVEAQHDFVEQSSADLSGRSVAAGGAAKMQPNAIFILIVLASLLTALAAIFIVNGRPTTPLCSQQPDWNQHNCRQG